MDLGAIIGPLLVSLLIAIVIFLILRALALWYWRVNDIIARLDRLLFFASGGTESLGSSPIDGSNAPVEGASLGFGGDEFKAWERGEFRTRGQLAQWRKDKIRKETGVELHGMMVDPQTGAVIGTSPDAPKTVEPPVTVTDLKTKDEYAAWKGKKIVTRADLEAFRGPRG